jgi:hypothetical protein
MNLSPRTQQLLVTALGSLIATAPFVVPQLEPYALLLVPIGTALGGAVLVKRPGDTRGAR